MPRMLEGARVKARLWGTDDVAFAEEIVTAELLPCC